jgi:hypothetical protein
MLLLAWLVVCVQTRRAVSVFDMPRAFGDSGMISRSGPKPPTALIRKNLHDHYETGPNGMLNVLSERHRGHIRTDPRFSIGQVVGMSRG